MSAVLSDPEWCTCAPDDEDSNVSLQPLGDAQVLVEYAIDAGLVVIRGAWVQGELVDAEEFALTRREFWRAAIQCEFDSERDGAFA